MTKRPPRSPLPPEHRQPVQTQASLSGATRERTPEEILIEKRIRDERKARARAQSQRIAELAKPDGGLLHGGDMGHGSAIARGLVEVNKDDHVPLDPDGDRSLVRIMARAKKVWAPDRLIQGRNPAIEPFHWDAAHKFLQDYLIGELGAKPNADIGMARLDPWNRSHYSEQRAIRRQSWQMATKAVGPSLSGILVWCVLQETDGPDVPPTVERWAARVDWPVARAVGYLRGALDALAAWYGYTPARHPTGDRKAAETRRRERGEREG